MIAFRYYGGKNSHLSWLLPLLPEDESVEHYVEPFCGSAAVLLNRKPAPCETINDLNGRVVNFFRALREQPLKLIRSIKMTPYSEEEFYLARQESQDMMEDARRFIIARSLGMGFGCDKKTQSFRMMLKAQGQYSSPAKAWVNAGSDWLSIAKRLATVQIANRDGISLIEQCDCKSTMFYIDPPYLLETRNGIGYKNEMSDADHDRLLSVLSNLKGRAALSGYPSEKYDSHFAKLGWNRFEKEVRSTIGKKKMTRTEVVWMNYDPVKQDLFGGIAV